MLSGIFAFSAGMIIGVSGFYNIPRTTKLFSGTWFGNIAFGQFIKFITYYPFNWVFNFWQKTYFRGD